MILPIYTELERIPTSLLNTSNNLNNKTWTTFHHVVLPLAFPTIVTGSIFTFSLTLNNYITPQLINSKQFINNIIYTNVNITNNLPLATAFTTIPIIIIIIYLMVTHRLNAFKKL